jgi:hypothetical protein
LLALLHGRWRRRVVTVVAGPGFGKTVLLGQAVQEHALRAHGVDLVLDAACLRCHSTVRALR